MVAHLNYVRWRADVGPSLYAGWVWNIILPLKRQSQRKLSVFVLEASMTKQCEHRSGCF